jgi:pimeloyl-ACP methyl ester carboxylesterase
MSGGELFYYDSAGNADSDPNGANGKTTIVLIHGLGDEADTWRHIFPLLVGAGYRIIAPDLPGFGRSIWRGRISMRGHRRAITQLITIIGAASAEKPAVLAGSSLGAGIAEMIAYKRPYLVKALILLDGCLPFEFKADKTMFLMSLPFFGRTWYRAFRSNHEAAWRSLYPYYGNLDAMSEADKTFLRERVIARVESDNQERGYFSTLRSMNSFILFRRRAAIRIGLYCLRGIKPETNTTPKQHTPLCFSTRSVAGVVDAPTKIAMLWGEKDRVFLPRRADLLRRLRPDANFVFIAGAGHLPHQEKPDACAAEMLKFLQQELGL